MINNKRGVSELVSYVLLISITFAIAAIVYSWLMFYVTPAEELKCDDGVALNIRSTVYNCTTKSLNITLQNRGLFSVDGYKVRVNNRTDADIGVYTINRTGRAMNTSALISDYYVHANVTDGGAASIKGNLTFIEIQPYKIIENQTIVCDSVARHNVVCS